MAAPARGQVAWPGMAARYTASPGPRAQSTLRSRIQRAARWQRWGPFERAAAISLGSGAWSGRQTNTIAVRNNAQKPPQTSSHPRRVPTRHQVAVNVDLAELVLDDGDAIAMVPPQDVVQQSCLTAAQEAGDDLGGGREEEREGWAAAPRCRASGSCLELHPAAAARTALPSSPSRARGRRRPCRPHR